MPIDTKELRAHARGPSNAGGMRDYMFELADQIDEMQGTGQFSYDSTLDTMDHIHQVDQLLNWFESDISQLTKRYASKPKISNCIKIILVLNEMECRMQYMYSSTGS